MEGFDAPTAVGVLQRGKTFSGEGMQRVPISKWLEQQAGDGLSPRQLIQFRWALGHLARALGKSRVEELHPGALQGSVDVLEEYLRREGHSLKVGREVRYWLRRLQRELAQRKVLPKAPMKAWRLRARLTSSWQRLYDHLAKASDSDANRLALRALTHLGMWATAHHLVPSTLTTKALEAWIGTLRAEHPRQWRRLYAALRRQVVKAPASAGLAHVAWPVPAPRFSQDYLLPSLQWSSALRKEWAALLEEVAPIFSKPSAMAARDRRERIWRGGIEAYLGYLVRVRGYDPALPALSPGRRGTLWAFRSDNLHRYLDWQLGERRARAPLRRLSAFLETVRLCFPKPEAAQLVAFLREARVRLAERRHPLSVERAPLTAEMLRALPERIRREAGRTEGRRRAAGWSRDAALLSLLTTLPLKSRDLAGLTVRDLKQLSLPARTEEFVRSSLRARENGNEYLLVDLEGRPLALSRVRERVRFWTRRLIGVSLSPRRFRQIVHADK
ncbi:MAG: hypothetical protein HZA23_07615 [Nitrospirae bacterium]|nr:hypothetical protein [Nitrospirota bacterium]